MKAMNNIFGGKAIIDSVINRFESMVNDLREGIDKCEKRIDDNKSKVYEIEKDIVEQETAIFRAENMIEKISQFTSVDTNE